MMRKVIIGAAILSMWTFSSFAMDMKSVEDQYSKYVKNKQYTELSAWLANMPDVQRQNFFESATPTRDTPLNRAVRDAFWGGDMQLAETLLKSGASADAVSVYGNTPFLALMSVASQKGISNSTKQKAFKDIVNLLLSYSKKPRVLMRPRHVISGQKITPLELAIAGKFPQEIVWFLLDKDIEIPGKTFDGIGIFTFAQQQHYPLEKILQEWTQDRYARPELTIEGVQDVGIPKDLADIISDYAAMIPLKE